MSLLRTFELGRTVLASTKFDLELWLAAFVTLLIPQANTEIQQSSTRSLLDQLSSGAVWVPPAHDLHLVIEPTLGNEPFTDHLLQHLKESVLQLPLWDQLMLEPNLSLDTATSPGTIRLDLAQASHEDTNNRQKCPRLPVQVPAADVGASDGIASVTLHAVRLCVDVLEPRQSTNPKAKRSRAPTNIDAVRSVPDAYRKDLGSEREFEVFGNKNSLSHPIVRNDSQKRRRLTTTHHQHGQAEEHDDDVVDALLDQESYSTECETDVPGSQANCAAAHLVSLIEGAMMVVITGSLGKSANGFKMKANTIQRGLSDIAPTIWRPGFATTLRQRAYLAPTISQSMAHMICSEIDKSPSVPSSRVINLVAIIEHDFKDNGKDVGIVPNKRRNKVSTALTDQVWMHMHNALCL